MFHIFPLSVSYFMESRVSPDMTEVRVFLWTFNYSINGMSAMAVNAAEVMVVVCGL